MFTEWMVANKIDKRGRSLLCANFLPKFTWHQKEKEWRYRMSTKSIGRIIYVHLPAEELYYSCLLVNEIKGSRSYEDLHTINGVVYATY